MKVQTPENIVIEENLADQDIEADKVICCPDCNWNQSDWDEYQRNHPQNKTP